MAENIARAGFSLTVWNRTASAAEELGARTAAHVARTPGESAAGADVVITMLADGAALDAVYCAADGVLSALRPGVVALDMGTSGPDVVRNLARQVDATGAAFVDAPVSGSVGAARSASLTVMAGGTPAAVDRARPVLAAVASAVYHVGPSGSGATLKLAVNAALFALTESIAESLVLCERSGIDPAVAYDVFCHSAVAAPAVAYRRDAFLRPNAAPASFRLALAAKDLDLLLAHAVRIGAPMPLARAASDIVAGSVAAGFGEADLAALASVLRAAVTPAHQSAHFPRT